jgi:hypothetical protein
LAVLSKASPAASSSVSPSSWYSPTPVDAHQLAVAAGDEQGDKREGRRSRESKRREQVAFEVVNRDGRDAERRGQSFGEGGADQQRAGEPRALRVGDGIDGVERAAAVGQTLRSSGTVRRMWSREASSGTTPPYSWCISDLRVQA